MSDPEEVKQREQEYRALAEFLPEIVFEANTHGQLVFVNSNAFRLMGYTEADFRRGLSITDLVAPEERESAAANIRQVLTSRTPSKGNEYTMVRKDGSRFPCMVFSAPILTQGQTSGLRGILVDISERKRAESERAKLETQIENAQRLESLGVLAGGIAHDFNNLLAAILGNADLALLDLPPDSPTRESLEDIRKAARRASEMTNQLLAYSGKGRFVVQTASINELIRDMGHLIRVSVSKRAAVQYQLFEGIPKIRCDAGQIRQVIMSLVTNASDACSEDNGVVVIETGLRRLSRARLNTMLLGLEAAEGSYGLLHIADNGCGMPPEVAERVFEPFFSTKFAGHGLGLSAVLGIVRSHQGVVELHSVPGAGTSVSVYFPCDDPQRCP